MNATFTENATKQNATPMMSRAFLKTDTVRFQNDHESNTNEMRAKTAATARFSQYL